jgi:hypothetical protein
MWDIHVSLSSKYRALYENNGPVNTFQRTKELWFKSVKKFGIIHQSLVVAIMLNLRQCQVDIYTANWIRKGPYYSLLVTRRILSVLSIYPCIWFTPSFGGLLC